MKVINMIITSAIEVIVCMICENVLSSVAAEVLFWSDWLSSLIELVFEELAQVCYFILFSVMHVLC